MRKFFLPLLVGALIALPASAGTESMGTTVKHDAKVFGIAVKHTAVKIGHAAKKFGLRVAAATKQGVREVRAKDAEHSDKSPPK